MTRNNKELLWVIVVVGLLTLVVILFGTGCSVVPTSPTMQPTSVSVVVRAFTQQPHEPIEGAIVSVDGHIRGTTDQFGELSVSVISGRDVTIQVTKDGYQCLLTAATGHVSVDGEVWTFYFNPSAQ